MRIVSLTNAQVAIGLRLGGIKECHTVDNPEAGEDILLELVKDNEIGILILDEDVANFHHKLIDKIRSEKRIFPIIVEIQTTTKQQITTGVDPLKDLIKRAIGVDISAQKDQEIKKPK